MVEYLDYDTVVAINREFGGPGAGVRDANGVRSAVSQPQQSFEGDAYRDIWTKAAVLIRGIAAAQNFTDGSKRTAWLSGRTFFDNNGVKLRNLPVEFQEVFVQAVAAGSIDLMLAAEWLRAAATARSRARFPAPIPIDR